MKVWYCGNNTHCTTQEAYRRIMVNGSSVQHTISRTGTHTTSGHQVIESQGRDRGSAERFVSDKRQEDLKSVPCRTVGELDIPCCYMQRIEGVGEGLTIVGVQQGQGSLPAPVHPSLRNDQRKRKRP